MKLGKKPGKHRGRDGLGAPSESAVEEAASKMEISNPITGGLRQRIRK